MLTLLSECHFWTMRDDVRIKSTDFGAFRYIRNRDMQHIPSVDQVYFDAKRDYVQRRNGLAVLKSSRKATGRLKDNLKRLEELLRMQKVIRVHWTDAVQVLFLFSNGIIAHICIDVCTGDILRMVYEKYLVGKLVTDHNITDAFFTSSHIAIAYNTNQVTVVNLQKPNTRIQGPEKIANMEPKVFHALIPGAPERKLPRQINVNSNGELFVIWTKSSQNEVFPWRPTLRDQDCANIHVFKLRGTHLDFLAYCWSENDPLYVDFLRTTDNQIITLEQKISRKGDVSAEICSYEIGIGKMQRGSLSCIPVGTQITCFAFSPDQEKLFLGSVGRNICLHDLILQSTKFATQIDIIPTRCSWHSDSSLIIIGNTRSQFQCYDLALTPIAHQLLSDDVTPSNLLDLSHYFVSQPTLWQISFSRKAELGHDIHKYAPVDCFLLLLYDQGPLGCLRFLASAGMRGDLHNSGLTADVLLDRYLHLHQLEKAVNLLCALNWETYGAMCLISLHKIANYVFYNTDSRKVRIELMAKALKTFTDSLSEDTKDEFSDQIFDLKRRFFFYLLRHKQFAEAFEVAQDIEDYDLFMDIFNITKTNQNFIEFSSTAFSQAAAILHEEDRANDNLSIAVDYRSESPCSQFTMSDFVVQSRLQKQQVKHQKFLKSYVPPLPSFKSKVFNAEMVKIPKPELRIDTNTNQTNNKKQEVLTQLPVSESKINKSTNSIDQQHLITSKLANLTLKSGGTPIHNYTSNDDTDYTENVCLPKCYDVNTTVSSNITPSKTLTFNNSSNLNSNMNTPITAVDHLPMLITQQRNYQQQQLPVIAIPTYQPKFFQHPLVSGHIPPTSSTSLAAHSTSNEEYQKSLLSKKPTASILLNGNTNSSNGYHIPLFYANGNVSNGNNKDVTTSGIGNKNNSGEKNKVKFSDTVQVAVVPAVLSLQDIPRKDKCVSMRRNGYGRPQSVSHNYTNPKKELADSLPLCHPNDEYLKDFNPLSTGTLKQNY